MLKTTFRLHKQIQMFWTYNKFIKTYWKIFSRPISVFLLSIGKNDCSLLTPNRLFCCKQCSNFALWYDLALPPPLLFSSAPHMVTHDTPHLLFVQELLFQKGNVPVVPFVSASTFPDPFSRTFLSIATLQPSILSKESQLLVVAVHLSRLRFFELDDSLQTASLRPDREAHECS